MVPIDLTKLLKPYKSGWVALSRDYKKVVSSAKTLDELDTKLEKIDKTEVVLISASQNYRGFIT